MMSVFVSSFQTNIFELNMDLFSVLDPTSPKRHTKKKCFNAMFYKYHKKLKHFRTNWSFTQHQFNDLSHLTLGQEVSELPQGLGLHS